MADAAIPIGELRWPVMLAERRQEAQHGGAGIDEMFLTIGLTRARVRQIYMTTFWTLSDQTERPITHLIGMRWLNVLSNTQVILRSTLLRDRSPQVEVFRVRRMRTLDGPRRWVEAEVELEDVLHERFEDHAHLGPDRLGQEAPAPGDPRGGEHGREGRPEPDTQF